MTTTFKFILLPVGGVLGGILALALKQGQILSESFDGRWIAVTFALGGLLVGHYIDNNRECAQIARELKEEGIEVANGETDTLGRLLIYQSGATRFGSVYYAICTLLSWSPAIVLLFLTRARSELPYVPYIFFAAGLLTLLTIPMRGLKSIRCYERGVILRSWRKSRVVRHSEVAGVEFLAVAKYYNFIYQGTISHFEVIPCAEPPVKVRIWGSKRDGHRIWQIVQVILKANPNAQLLNIN